MNAVNIICKNNINIEKNKNRLTKLILLTPKFQKIINSLLSSYLAITYEKLKKMQTVKFYLLFLENLIEYSLNKLCNHVHPQ